MHLQTASKIIVANKPGRLDDLKAIREKWISEGFKAGMPEALSLRGKINYAEGQTHSRVSAPLARLLSIWSGEAGARPVTRALKLLVDETITALTNAGPREVLVGCSAPPVLVFADGACEEGVVTIGAVVIDQVARPEAFGARVGQELVD